MEKKTTYKIEVTRIDSEQYEENKTFYLGNDKKQYTFDSDDEVRTKHTEPTGRILWEINSKSIYEQTVEEVDIVKIIEAVNK